MVPECGKWCLSGWLQDHQWICENIAVIRPRRQRPSSKKATQINETFEITLVRDIRLGLTSGSTIDLGVDTQDGKQIMIGEGRANDF